MTPSPSSPASIKRDATPEDALSDDTEALLVNYFNLQHNLTELYKQWGAADPNFQRRASTFTGVRMLNQDAREALLGFICSSNNNIKRISNMMNVLCHHYGPYIGTIDEVPFHDFPTLTILAAPGVESRLRSLGFGYRARYIADTARRISQEKPAGWLDSLRNPTSPAWGATAPLPSPVAGDQDSAQVATATYEHAREQLLELVGVGPKVADCVCLMGLGWSEVVPVDTHVWQIATRDYKLGKSSNAKGRFSKAAYIAVGNHFRALWGDYAGWAHSVLFTADLKAFSEQSVEKVEDETETKVVKLEPSDDTLLTPAATPVGTPAKKRRTVVEEAVKVELKGEDGSEAGASVASVKRRRTRRSQVSKEA